MKRASSFWGPGSIFLTVLCLVVASLADPAHGSSVHPEARAAVLQNPLATHILVFGQKVDVDATASDLATQYGLAVTRIYRHALPGVAAVVPPDQLEALERDGRVAYVEANQALWLNEQTVPTGVRRAGGEGAASASTDGTDQRVDVDIAVIDTGIDLDHPDLNVYQWANCAGGDTTGEGCQGADADDGNGHGTHVAGTAAARDNGIGTVGVAPGARLWAVKVLNSNGSGWMDSLISGVDYVTAHAGEIEVANMSLGCRCSSRALDDAIARSVAGGVVYVVAAGNSARDAAALTPASHPDVITVSAIADYDGAGRSAFTGKDCYGYSPPYFGHDDTFASFSGFGRSVEIAAPGVCILSTWKDGGYQYRTGTSMASPHVAGAAALVRASNPEYSPAEVLAALLSSATPQGDPEGFTEDPDQHPEPLLSVARKASNNTAPGGE